MINSLLLLASCVDTLYCLSLHTLSHDYMHLTLASTYRIKCWLFYVQDIILCHMAVENFNLSSHPNTNSHTIKLMTYVISLYIVDLSHLCTQGLCEALRDMSSGLTMLCMKWSKAVNSRQKLRHSRTNLFSGSIPVSPV